MLDCFHIVLLVKCLHKTLETRWPADHTNLPQVTDLIQKLLAKNKGMRSLTAREQDVV